MLHFQLGLLNICMAISAGNGQSFPNKRTKSGTGRQKEATVARKMDSPANPSVFGFVFPALAFLNNCLKESVLGRSRET